MDSDIPPPPPHQRGDLLVWTDDFFRFRVLMRTLLEACSRCLYADTSSLETL